MILQYASSGTMSTCQDERILQYTSSGTTSKSQISTGLSNGLGSLDKILTDICKWPLPNSPQLRRTSIRTTLAPLIQPEIQNAYRCFKSAEAELQNETEHLHDELELNTSQVGQVKAKIAEDRHALSQSEQQLKTAEQNYQLTKELAEKARNDFNDYQRHVSDADRKLSKDKKRSATAKFLTVGGVLFAPFTGGATLVPAAVAGAAAVVKHGDVESSRAKLRCAEQALTAANETVQKHENEVSDFKNNKIPALEKKVKSSELQLNENEEKRQALQNSYQEMVDVCEKVKCCLTYLSLLSGKTDVLHRTSLTFTSLEQIVIPMGDLVKHLMKANEVQDYQFLSNNSIDFASINDKFHAIHKEIQNSDSSSAVEDFI